MVLPLKKYKRAAMEMSIGTMVTIVLLMVLLVLGIFFIQKIFGLGTNAIDQIDNQVSSELQRLFEREGKTIVVYPTSRQVILKKGGDPKGFAFSVRNNENQDVSYSFNVKADDVSRCGPGFTTDIANSYLIGGNGTFNIPLASSLEQPRLVLLDIPDSAPECTISYSIEVNKVSGGYYTGTNIFVTIK